MSSPNTPTPQPPDPGGPAAAASPETTPAPESAPAPETSPAPETTPAPGGEEPRARSRPARARPPLLLGLFVLLVLPFVVLAAVIHRGAVLGTPPDAVLLHNGQSFVSDGDRVDLYVPSSVAGVDQCRFFDEDNRVLAAGPPRRSLQTEIGQVGYSPVLTYRAQPGTVITVGCALSPGLTLLVTPPITRQSVLLPLVVGAALGFATIAAGAAMLGLRRRRLIARLNAREPG